jgi:hypothetical protein
MRDAWARQKALGIIHRKGGFSDSDRAIIRADRERREELHLQIYVKPPKLPIVILPDDPHWLFLRYNDEGDMHGMIKNVPGKVKIIVDGYTVLRLVDAPMTFADAKKNKSHILRCFGPEYHPTRGRKPSVPHAVMIRRVKVLSVDRMPPGSPNGEFVFPPK